MPGQRVEVAAGSYRAQRIDRDPAKSSTGDVVFEPRGGDVVRLESLSLGDSQVEAKGASRVTFRGFAIETTIAAYDTSHVTWDEIDAQNFYVNSVRQLVISGGDFGPCTSSVERCSNSKIDRATGSQRNDGIRIDGALFHDYRVGKAGDHFECLFIWGGTNITIRGSTFYNCDIYDIFIQNSGQPIEGLTIENNWFDAPGTGEVGKSVPGRVTAVAFSPRERPFVDVLLRYNSFFRSGIAVNDDGDGTAYRDFRVVANILQSSWGSCYGTATFRHNVWSGERCHRSDRSLSGGQYPYVSPTHGPELDYRLRGGVAVDLVSEPEGDLAIARDIQGTARPIGPGWDAGAHERARRD